MPPCMIRVRRVHSDPRLQWEGVIVTIHDEEMPEFPVQIEWIKGNKGRENFTVLEFTNQCQIVKR